VEKIVLVMRHRHRRCCRCRRCRSRFRYLSPLNLMFVTILLFLFDLMISN